MNFNQVSTEKIICYLEIYKASTEKNFEFTYFMIQNLVEELLKRDISYLGYKPFMIVLETIKNLNN